jgi:O-antigen/teichoic acid export membrane protein
VPTPPEHSAPTDAADRLAPDEVKSRAAAGVVLLMGRGVALQAVGFLGNLVLARLLVPEDFGIVAVGLTIVNIGQLISGAGIGAALVARSEPPTKDELRALTGLQLLVTLTVAAIAAAGAIAIGDAALVTAVMVLALPLTALRTPAMLLFQRRLEFVQQLKVEIAEVVTALAVSIPLAALGFGAWSLAISTVARCLVGTTSAMALSPVGPIMPSLELRRIRSILGFGWRFQATGVSQLAQETALTAAIGAVAGLGVLGIWSFAARILKIPQLLFESMWKVGFPAFSRLLETDARDGMRDLLERTVGTMAVGVSFVMTPIVGASPALVPLLFGAHWADVSLILPGAALALSIGGAIGMVSASYFYASGDANTGLLATSLHGAVRVTLTLALLPTIGVAGIGVAWAFGSVAAMVITVPRARRACGARLELRVIAPAVSLTAGGLAGWLLAEELGVALTSAVVAAVAALAVWFPLMLVLSPRTCRETWAMCHAIVGSAFRRAAPFRRRPVTVPSSTV